MSSAPYEIVILGDLFSEEYYKAFEKPEFSPSFTPADLEDEWEDLTCRLRATLGARWEEDAFMEGDFVVSDEFQGTFHHCGAIYSVAACCTDYVSLIIDAIAAQPHASQWTYHTTVEPTDDDEDLENEDQELLDQFFIREGKLWTPEDCPQLRRWFG